MKTMTKENIALWIPVIVALASLAAVVAMMFSVVFFLFSLLVSSIEKAPCHIDMGLVYIVSFVVSFVGVLVASIVTEHRRSADSRRWVSEHAKPTYETEELSTPK